MTLTTEQLHELEAKATEIRNDAGARLAIPPLAVLHLVAVYRAALAWAEQREIADENWPNMRSEASNEVDAAVSLIAALRGTP